VANKPIDKETVGVFGTNVNRLKNRWLFTYLVNTGLTPKTETRVIATLRRGRNCEWQESELASTP
jgi:hypothetical protein